MSTDDGYDYPPPLPAQEPPAPTWEPTDPYDSPAEPDPTTPAPTSGGVDTDGLDLGQLALDVTQLLESSRIITGTLTEHESVLEHIVTTLEKLTKAPPKSKPSPFSWHHATGQTREALWDDLTAWVDAHNARHGRRPEFHIEECWYRHPMVVDLLTALMEAWRVAYIGHQAPTNEAIYYLNSFLHPTLQAIRSQPWGLSLCGGAHRESDPDRFRVRDTYTYEQLRTADLTAHPAPDQTTEEDQ